MIYLHVCSPFKFTFYLLREGSHVTIYIIFTNEVYYNILSILPDSLRQLPNCLP